MAYDSDPYKDAHLLYVFADKKQNGFLLPRFSRDEEDAFMRWAKKNLGPAFKQAAIEWVSAEGAGIRRGSILMLLLDTPKKLESAKALQTDRIRLRSYQDYLAMKAKQNAKYARDREEKEFEDLPRQIAELEKRYAVLKNKFTTRVWLRPPSEHTDTCL